MSNHVLARRPCPDPTGPDAPISPRVRLGPHVPLSRRALLGGPAALAGLLLSACTGSSGSSAPGKVIWSTWGSPEELVGFDRVQESFSTDHPEIDLVFNPVPSYTDFHSKLVTQLIAGKAPDVFYIGDDRVASLTRDGALLGLRDRLGATSGGLSLEDINPQLLDAASWQGELYALPNDTNPDTLWYDKQALQDAGITEDPAELAERDEWTTSAYFEMLSKLQAAGLTGAAYYNYWATHWSWITSQGGQVYDETFIAHQDATSCAALQEFADRFTSGQLVIADLLPEGAGADSLLVTHRLGFFAAGRYTIATIRGAGVDEDLYDVVRWPSPDGRPSPTGVAASFLAINADTVDPDAAMTFFEAFLGAEGQRLRLAGDGGAVPSLAAVDDLVMEEGFPAHARTMLEMRDLGYSSFPEEASVPGLSDDISVNHMLPMYQGKVDAATTLENVAELVARKAEK